MSEPAPFGAPMLQHFCFDPTFKNLNHGSFGTYPLAIRTALRKYQDAAEARPDPFIRSTQPAALTASRRAVADLLSVPAQEVVLVKNATTGVHTVLHNLGLREGDVVVYFDTVYGALERMLISIGEQSGVQGRKVAVRFPVGVEEIVKGFRETVLKAQGEGLRVRAALFETVISMPAVRFPFERVVEVCRELGVLSVIDGAHGVGQIPLELGSLKPDFFTSNCHKYAAAPRWLYVPRGCAVLYVPQRNQHLIRTTLPTSWGFIPSPDSAATGASTMQIPGGDKSAFEALFEFVATSDDTPYLCIPAAIQFRKEVCGGEARIHEYMWKLANEAAEVFSAALGTEAIQEPDVADWRDSMYRRCAMTTVRLPIPVRDGWEEDPRTGFGAQGKRSLCEPLVADKVPGVCRWMHDALVERAGTFLPVFAHGGWLWTRLSAQVYLEKRDFEWAAGIFKELCDEVVKT